MKPVVKAQQKTDAIVKPSNITIQSKAQAAEINAEKSAPTPEKFNTLALNQTQTPSAELSKNQTPRIGQDFNVTT